MRSDTLRFRFTSRLQFDLKAPFLSIIVLYGHFSTLSMLESKRVPHLFPGPVSFGVFCLKTKKPGAGGKSSPNFHPKGFALRVKVRATLDCNLSQRERLQSTFYS